MVDEIGLDKLKVDEMAVHKIAVDEPGPHPFPVVLPTVFCISRTTITSRYSSCVQFTYILSLERQWCDG